MSHSVTNVTILRFIFVLNYKIITQSAFIILCVIQIYYLFIACIICFIKVIREYTSLLYLHDYCLLQLKMQCH